MRLKVIFIGFVLMLMTDIQLFGQAMAINGISKRNGYPTEQITISGSGFNATPDQNLVWFGQVEGRVVAATAFNLTVEVPVQASYNNIEVTNLQTKLSAKTPFRFAPYFSGKEFNASSFKTPPYTLGPDVQQFFNNSELLDVCSCDLNRDKKPDLVGTSLSDANLVILKNESSVKNLSFKRQLQAVQFPSDKIICNDLNGDGKPELIFSRSNKSSNLFVFSILVNTSTTANITFNGTRVELQLPNKEKDKARFIVARDLNDDGKPELIVSNINSSGNFFVFVNKTSGGSLQFDPTPLTFDVSGASSDAINGLSVEDFDGDRKPDVVVSKYQAGTVFILKNTSTTSVSLASPIVVNLPNKFINKLVVGDLNNDALSDIVMTDFFGGEIIYLLNSTKNGILSFTTPTAVALKIPTDVGAPGPDGLDIVDINGDKKPDMVVSLLNRDRIAVLIGDGAPNVSFTLGEVRTEKFSRNIVAADFDGDAKPELAFTSFSLTPAKYSLDILRNQTCFIPEIINEKPQGKSAAICVGQTIILKTIPGFGVTYDWKNNGAQAGVTAVPQLSINSPGSYTVSPIGEAVGCTGVSAAYEIVSDNTTVPPLPGITGPSEVCENGSIDLAATSVQGAAYQWKGPDGKTLSTTTETLKISNAALNSGGRYSVQIQKGECLTDPVFKTIDVVGLGEFQIKTGSETNAICGGQGLTLSVGSVNNYTYQWTKAGVNIPGATTASFDAKDAGLYSVQVSYPSIPGCSKNVTPQIEVKVIAKPETAFTAPVTACAGVANIFESTTKFPAGAPNAVYNWNFASGGISTKSKPDPVTFPVAGTLTITLTVGYQGLSGCEQSVSKSIVVELAVVPKIISPATESCPEEVIGLSLAGTFQKITWSTGAGTNSVSIDQPGKYFVTTTDAKGCVGSDTLRIISKTVPVVVASADRQSILAGEKVQLSATGADTWEWQPADNLDDPTLPNPIASPLVTTIFIAKGTLNGACFARDSVEVKVTGESGFPNVFSPNGDGSNDTWVLEGITSFSECFLSIFDRSGRRIFEAKGYANDWDGTSNGKPLPEGTYYYVMGCPDRPPITGTILIAR